jgi:zinc/manganese transport system substrate-binding protein
MTRTLLFLTVLLAALHPNLAAASMKVVTSTQDLAAIVQAVGGSDVSVSYIARGDLDPHFVDAKPSYMVKLASADLVVAVGLELEIGWLPSLLTGSRNPKVQPGAAGYLDASAAVSPIEVPTGAIDRSRGDIHPLGNPHYWLDPENGRKVARLVAQKLSTLDGAHAAAYATNLASFESTLTQKEATWKAKMAPLEGANVVGYHSTFDYLCATYGMNVVGFVEPKPGIPPTPAHTLEIAEKAKAAGAKRVLVEPYHNPSGAQPIADACGAKIVVVPTSVGSATGIETYFDLFDHIVAVVTGA